MSTFSVLCARLKSLSLTPALPVAWPDVHFVPPSDQKFLEALFFVNPTESEIGYTHESGIFQVNVFWPTGLGRVAPLAIAEQVKAHFAKGTSLSENVRLDRAPWIGSAISSNERNQTSPYKGNYTIIPVSIPWAK